MRERMFPIMGCKSIRSIPWRLLEPHEATALRNHSQDLEKLASRGGLGASEAVAIIRDLRFNDYDIDVFERLGEPGNRIMSAPKDLHDRWIEQSVADLTEILAADTPPPTERGDER